MEGSVTKILGQEMDSGRQEMSGGVLFPAVDMAHDDDSRAAMPRGNLGMCSVCSGISSLP